MNWTKILILGISVISVNIPHSPAHALAITIGATTIIDNEKYDKDTNLLAIEFSSADPDPNIGFGLPGFVAKGKVKLESGIPDIELAELSTNFHLSLTDFMVERTGGELGRLSITYEHLFGEVIPLFGLAGIFGEFNKGSGGVINPNNNISFKGFVNGNRIGDPVNPIFPKPNQPSVSRFFRLDGPESLPLLPLTQQLSGEININLFQGNVIKLPGSADIAIAIVPEPSSSLGIIGFGILGLALTLKWDLISSSDDRPLSSKRTESYAKRN